MSEERNINISFADKDEHLESTIYEDNNPRPSLDLDESLSIEKVVEPSVQDNQQPLDQPGDQDIPLESPEKSVEEADSCFEKNLNTPEATSETKSLEGTDEVHQPAAKSIEISTSLVPSSDKALEEVTENIQLIQKELKYMKIRTQESPGAVSGRKSSKSASTPRAKSTPVKPLTSPPLTRSRSRDLRKFQSTPSSPGGSAADRKTSESDSDEVKGVRGRQRVKKN